MSKPLTPCYFLSYYFIFDSAFPLFAVSGYLGSHACSVAVALIVKKLLMTCLHHNGVWCFDQLALSSCIYTNF